MPRYVVALRFESGDDRELVVPRLRALATDAELTDLDGDGSAARLVFDDVESPIAALVRAQILVHTACAGTDVAPTRVRRTPAA